MTSLTPLIERIEAATEGSRELDGDIALLVGWEPTHERSSNLKWAYTYPSCRERWRGDRRPFDNWNVPRYSTSIDAALSLVPEGHHYTIEPDGAWIRFLGKDDVDEFQSVLMRRGGKCTALALCAASLRAIHQGRSK